jgi:hypothetical protein
MCRALRLFVVDDRPELHAAEIQLNWTENGPLMWNGLQPGGSSMDAGPRQRPLGEIPTTRDVNATTIDRHFEPLSGFLLVQNGYRWSTFRQAGGVWLPDGMPMLVGALPRRRGQCSSKCSLLAENVYRWSFGLIATFR